MTNNQVINAKLKEEAFKEYRKKPIVVKAYRTDEELEIETLEGTMRADVGDYIILGVKGEPYPCKPDIFQETYESVNDEDTSVEEFVLDNCIEWSNILTDLTHKEKQLYQLKNDYQIKSDKVLEDARKHLDQTGEDIIKTKYGGNNDKTRKQYVKDTMKEDAEKLKKLEFTIEYMKRRLTYLKSLVDVKTAIMESKK